MIDKIEQAAQKYLENKEIPPGLEEPTKNLVVEIMSHDCYNNPEYEWSLNDFELGNRLGRGKLGRVYLAREKKTRFVVAIKTLLKKEIVKEQIERQILREIEIQSHLKHPNIVQLLCWFHDSHRIYLVVEYAGKGELYKELHKSPKGRFCQQRAAKCIYQIADAVNYCHSMKVIHRDIKPENIMVTFDDDFKLADFGWSVHSPSLERATICGTLVYLSPEMVEQHKYGKFVDHWCIGVLCYELLVGHTPFESESTEIVYNKIRKSQFKFPEYVPEVARNLISKLLILSDERRLSLDKVMKHPWIVANKDLPYK